MGCLAMVALTKLIYPHQKNCIWHALLVSKIEKGVDGCPSRVVLLPAQHDWMTKLDRKFPEDKCVFLHKLRTSLAW